MRHLMLVALVVAAGGTTAAQHPGLNSPDVEVRTAAFYAVMKGGAMTDADKQAIIALLEREIAHAAERAAADAEVPEKYGEYFSDVVTAVSELHDARSLPALIGVLRTGHMVADAVASFGGQAAPLLAAQLQSGDTIVRFAVMMTVNKMLAPANIANVRDAAARHELRAILLKAATDPDPDVRALAHVASSTFGPIDIPGDVNDDGAVDCSDVAIVRAAIAQRPGMTGFDPRADVNADRLVSVIDLATVTRGLPVGARCP